MKRNEFGEILEEEFAREIDFASTMEEVVELEELLDSEEVENYSHLRQLLDMKRSEFPLLC